MNEHSELVRLLRSISDDLTTMLRIEPIPRATGNCAAPIALYSLTSMSFIGYLISPSELPVYEYTQRIMACIEYSYCNENVTEFDAGLNANVITELYDGLAFFFVPLRLGIGRRLNGLFVPISGHSTVFRAIDVDRLAHMLIQFIWELGGVMLTDDDLCAKMWKRLMSFRELGKPVE